MGPTTCAEGEAMTDRVEDLTQLSDAELMEKWTDVGEQAQELHERLTAFSHEHQRREREAQLLRAVGEMTPEDLALLQGVAARGIESQAEVGNP